MRTLNVYCNKCGQSIPNGQSFFQLVEKRKEEVVMLGDICSKCIEDMYKEWKND